MRAAYVLHQAICISSASSRGKKDCSLAFRLSLYCTHGNRLTIQWGVCMNIYRAHMENVHEEMHMAFTV